MGEQEMDDQEMDEDETANEDENDLEEDEIDEAEGVEDDCPGDPTGEDESETSNLRMAVRRSDRLFAQLGRRLGRALADHNSR